MNFPYNESKYNVQTPLIKFKHSDLNIEVNLISTIHVGSLKYYEDILNYTNDADVVIYEGVDDREYKPSLMDKLHFNIFSKDVDVYRKNFTNRLHEINTIFKDNLVQKIDNLNDNELLELSKEYIIINQESFVKGNIPNWYCADITAKEIANKRNFSVKNTIKSFLIKVYFHYFNDDENFLNSTIDNFVNNPQLGIPSTIVSDGITTDSDSYRESKIYELLQDFEKTPEIKKIAIIYGVGHAFNIQEDLLKRKYQIEDKKFLNAFKRINSEGKLIDD